MKPGGRLVYVTCSMLSRENESSLAAFEAAHGDFRPIAPSDLIPQGDAALTALIDKAPGHTLRLSPASTGTDGFFFAAYERAA